MSGSKLDLTYCKCYLFFSIIFSTDIASVFCFILLNLSVVSLYSCSNFLLETLGPYLIMRSMIFTFSLSILSASLLFNM